MIMSKVCGWGGVILILFLKSFKRGLTLGIIASMASKLKHNCVNGGQGRQ